MELSNRIILITGGTSGIGYALAKQFIANSNQVIVCGRSQEKLNRVKAELPSVDTIRCDINSADDLNKLVSFLTCKYPGLDTLINNAGIQQQLNLTGNEVTDLEVTNEIGTNLTSHISITLHLYPLLSANSHPAIVFTSSALGIVPKYEVPIYSAAKAGIHSFVQSLRHQAKQESVQVFEIFPELVDTPMTQHRKNESKMDSDTFASAVMKQLADDVEEIYVGRAKILNLLNRIAPSLAISLINKTCTYQTVIGSKGH